MTEKPSFDQVPKSVEEESLTLNPACTLSRIMKKKLDAQNSEEPVCLDPDLACTFFAIPNPEYDTPSGPLKWDFFNDLLRQDPDTARSQLSVK